MKVLPSINIFKETNKLCLSVPHKRMITTSRHYRTGGSIEKDKKGTSNIKVKIAVQNDFKLNFQKRLLF